jgi:hypothetical protein
MSVRVLPEAEVLSPPVALSIELFRALAEFRQAYDEGILQDLFARLRRLTDEKAADEILANALALDNEIRFRMPAGLALRDQDDELVSPDEEALATLIGLAEEEDNPAVIAMAERLGIENHHVLRACASALARSLRRAGIEIELGGGPAVMPVTAYTATKRIGLCP